MKYLPKSYVFTDRDGFEISYSEMVDRIIDGFYLTFNFAPNRSFIRLISVLDGFLVSPEDYHCQCLFVVLDKSRFHGLPKRYILDVWSNTVEVVS